MILFLHYFTIKIYTLAHQQKQKQIIHHSGGYSKTRYKKLVTHVESHASAVSLLESRE